MKTVNHIAALVLFSALAFLGCKSSTTPPASDASPGQERESGSTSVDYGQEISRRVYQKDEIVSVLQNRMTVIVKRVPSPAVSVRAYVMAGGVYEGRWLGGGLSHLLEHLVAGGSNQRRTEAENRDLLQAIGNNSNAYTTADHTAYFVNTTADHLDQAVDLVTGWVLGAKITPAEYAREHEVVQRELEMDQGQPDYVFAYTTQRNRYHISPSKVPVIGYKAVIGGISRDDVYAYYKMAYQPNNMVFVITGNIEPEKMLQTVQKYVADAPPGRVFSHDIQLEPPVVAPRVLVCTFPKLGEARLELAWPSIRLTDPDLYALDLLSTLLARGESSVLVEEVRDKGLASDVSSYDETPSYNFGTFAIDLQLDMDKIPDAAKAVMSALEQVKKQGFSPERIEAAKTQTRTSRAFSLQTAEDIGESLANDFISTADPHFSDQYVQRIQQVTNDDLKRVAAKYLDNARLLTTAMLPAERVSKEGLAQAETMLRSLNPQAEQKSQQPASSPIVRIDTQDGTIVLLKRIATSKVVVMNLYGLGGLTAEDARTNGLGMLAMTSVTRGTKTRSAQQIAEFFDSIGGSVSATCGNNSWEWQAACLREDFDKTIPVFADIVKNATFPDDQVEQMRHRLLAGIQSQDANWFAQSMRFFKKTYFGPKDEPYQFMSIGTQENVSRFTPAELRQWYSDKVLKSRRVLAVFGDIDVDKAKQAVTAQFGGLADSSAPTPRTPTAALPTQEATRPAINVREVAINKSTNPQAGIIIGFDANPVVGEPGNYPLTVANTLCSGYRYPTGYIFETLRGKGLVYDSNAFPMLGRSEKLPGTFLVYAGCDPKNVDACINDMLLNIARLQGSPKDIMPDWFARAKKLIVTADAMENETAQQQAQTAALDELFGLGYAYHDQFAQKINSVELPQVQDTARRLLRSCVVTVTTSAPELVKTAKGQRTYDSFPAVDLTPKGVAHDTGGGH